MPFEPSSREGRNATLEDGVSSPDDASKALTPTVRHEVLVNDRRRAIVERLDGETSLRVLADGVAAGEAADGDPDRKLRQSVYITLHQYHLPKLADFGVVTYDPDRKIVRPDEGLYAVRDYLDRIDAQLTRRGRSARTRPYAGLGVLGLLVLLSGLLGGGWAGAEWLAAAVFLGVTLVAAWNLREWRGG